MGGFPQTSLFYTRREEVIDTIRTHTIRIVLCALTAALILASAFRTYSLAPWMVGYLLLDYVVFKALRTRACREGYRAMVAAGYRKCCYCGYQLDGLSLSGQCPECGESYSPDSLRLRWELTYALHFNDMPKYKELAAQLSDEKELVQEPAIRPVTDTPATPSPHTPHTPPASPTPPPGASTN